MASPNLAAPALDELRRVAIEVACDAAAFVAEARAAANLVLDTATKSTSTDMVTAVDKASEERIVATLQARRPDDGVQAEEGTGIPSRSGLRWVVDPIDGTTNFVYGYPATAVSIAVVDDATNESLAGAVVDIGRGEVWSALRGGGAFLDDAPLVLRDGPVDLAHTLVSTGFNYSAAVRAEQAAVVAHMLPIVRDFRRGGSAALDLCWAAAGRVDAYFERGTAPWDHAVGLLVAREVGLRGEVVGDLVWVAHPRIADELFALITR